MQETRLTNASRIEEQVKDGTAKYYHKRSTQNQRLGGVASLWEGMMKWKADMLLSNRVCSWKWGCKLREEAHACTCHIFTLSLTLQKRLHHKRGIPENPLYINAITWTINSIFPFSKRTCYLIRSCMFFLLFFWQGNDHMHPSSTQ